MTYTGTIPWWIKSYVRRVKGDSWKAKVKAYHASQNKVADLIRIQLPQDQEAAFQEACGHWPGCLNVGRKRGKVEIRTPDGGALLPVLQVWLDQRGIPLSQLEVDRPNLETLYLNLTGRSLRE